MTGLKFLTCVTYSIAIFYIEVQLVTNNIIGFAYPLAFIIFHQCVKISLKPKVTLTYCLLEVDLSVTIKFCMHLIGLKAKQQFIEQTSSFSALLIK